MKNAKFWLTLQINLSKILEVNMERKAFDKILNGLNEARTFARGEKFRD